MTSCCGVVVTQLHFVGAKKKIEIHIVDCESTSKESHAIFCSDYPALPENVCIWKQCVLLATAKLIITHFLNPLAE